MNTAKSVAYGWVVLVVAAGGSYYYAKKDLKGRKMDPALREQRMQQSNSGGTMTWQDRLKEMEDAAQSKLQQKGTSTVSDGNPSRPATRNLTKDIEMRSKPTGVDTPNSGPAAQEER